MTRSIFKVICLVAFVAASNLVGAQDYDLLIKNAHLIDAKNELDQAMDVAVLDGKVAEVSANIPIEKAKKVIDATGLIQLIFCIYQMTILNKEVIFLGPDQIRGCHKSNKANGF